MQTPPITAGSVQHIVDAAFARWCQKTFQHVSPGCEPSPDIVVTPLGDETKADSLLIRVNGTTAPLYLLIDLGSELLIRAIRPTKVRLYNRAHEHIARPLSDFLTQHGFVASRW